MVLLFSYIFQKHLCIFVLWILLYECLQHPDGLVPVPFLVQIERKRIGILGILRPEV